MIKKFAPAKINLFLHVVGKTKGNYHRIESLVTFADMGDWITITPSKEYSLNIEGPFAKQISAKKNLVTKAAQALASATKKKLNLSITIEKNIPVGAGLGGGSADAAATIHALLSFWETTLSDNILYPLLLKLGADVPMCFANQSAFIQGIGEVILPVNIPKNIHAVLIYPNKHCATAEIFDAYAPNFTPSLENIPDNLEKIFFEFLPKTKNDLTSAAINNIHDIEDVLDVLNNNKNCRLTRMTGSGSCCFGLFESKEDAKYAAEAIQTKNPTWWVKNTILNVE